MSTRQQGDSPASFLKDLIRREIASIPIAHWGYFYPVHVAVWRFIEAERPGVLGELHSGYDTEPYFKGKGSEWFSGTLGNRDEYLDLLEQIMYPIAASLTPEAKKRGFLLEPEVPLPDSDVVRRLTETVLKAADEGVAQALIK